MVRLWHGCWLWMLPFCRNSFKFVPSLRMADAGDKRGTKSKQTGKKNKRQTNIIADVSLQVTPPSNLMTSQINLPLIRPSAALLSQSQFTPPTSQLNPQPNANTIPQQSEPNLQLHSQHYQSNPLLVQSPTAGTHTPGTSSSGVGNDNNHNQLWIEPDGDGFLPHKPVIEGIASCIKSKFEEGKPSWKKFSRDTRDMWFEEFKKKFRWTPNHNFHIRENFEKRGASKLSQLLQKARIDGKKSAWIGDSAWTDLMKYWQSSTFRVKSEQNKKNRDSDAGASLHTGGSIPHRVHFKRMKAELGEDPPFSEFYFRTHKKKDNNWVNQKAQDAYENFEKKKSELSSQNTIGTENNSGDGIEQSQHMPSDMNIWMDTVGGNRKGRVAGLGSLGRTMKRISFGSSNSYDMNKDVEERIRSSVHSLNTSLQVQLEKERQEKEEMKKELSETKNTLNFLMEQLGFRPGTSSRPQISSHDKNDEGQQDKSDENGEESSDE